MTRMGVFGIVRSIYASRNRELASGPMVRRLVAGGRWIRTFGPPSGHSFFETPFERSGARPSAREEIGPAERDRPFRGAVPVAGDTARAIAILGIAFSRSGSIPRMTVISSLIWAADPSGKRPSAVRASFGEP